MSENQAQARSEDGPAAALLTVIGAVGLGVLGWTAVHRAWDRRNVRTATAVHAARRLNRAAGTLAACVLSDSVVEHYRGSFHNKTMFVPLASAALSLLASAHGAADPRRR
ncbi:MAG TPA: hypothetical protein VGL87_08485, partial [Steroidobacteraceae bacterium]